ncbi:hypothetical protein EVAR_6595_1 [Eumeta japonica]|uniref:Uncharacterized protein n=1 Tax=Eumeta variegata TaxID=151549 RepID=A0A4C1TKB4_EUMVA|nr:hypothetical protein EVAR_6595_1 [Eumeta japonica]
MCDGVLSGRNPRTENTPKAKQAENLQTTQLHNYTQLRNDRLSAPRGRSTKSELNQDTSLPQLSDHLPVLLKLGSFTGEEQSIETKTIIDWKRVSTALEKVDTPNLNVIPDDIVSNNDIDTTTRALTKHIRSVVKRCQKKVPANSDRRGLPRTFAN